MKKLLLKQMNHQSISATYRAQTPGKTGRLYYLILLIQDHFNRNEKQLLQLADGKISAKEKIDNNWVECSYGLRVY